MVKVVVDILPVDAWSLMSDFSSPHKYVPGILKTKVLPGPTSGVGAHRLVFDKVGKSIDETVIEWIEGSGFKMRLHQGEMNLSPFKYAQFNYHVSPEGSDSTLVELTMVFELHWGLLGSVIGNLIFRPVIKYRLMGVATGLKKFYENTVESSKEHIE